MSLINHMLLDLDARQGHHKTLDDNIVKNLQPVKVSDNKKKIARFAGPATAILTLTILSVIYAPLRHQDIANPIVEPLVISSNSVHQSDNSNTVDDKSKDTAPKRSIATHQAIAAAAPAPEAEAVKPVATLSTSAPQGKKKKAPTQAKTATVKLAIKAPTAITTTKILPLVTASTVQVKQRLSTQKQKLVNDYATALRYFKQGRLAESVQLLNEILQLAPQHIKAREVLGSLLMQQLRWQEAERLFMTGIELSPDYSPFKRLLARLKIEQGQEQQAIEILEKPLQQGKEDTESSALLGLLYQRKGQHELAAKHYKQALSAQPNRGKWWLGLAISLEAQQQWQTATQAYQLAANNAQLKPQLQQYAQQRQKIISQRQTSP